MAAEERPGPSQAVLPGQANQLSESMIPRTAALLPTKLEAASEQRPNSQTMRGAMLYPATLAPAIGQMIAAPEPSTKEAGEKVIEDAKKNCPLGQEPGGLSDNALHQLPHAVRVDWAIVGLGTSSRARKKEPQWIGREPTGLNGTACDDCRFCRLPSPRPRREYRRGACFQ
jgi:hypothetical protein